VSNTFFIQKHREHLCTVLFVLLPFHAFLVTVLTKVLAGAVQSPLPAVALWKEGVLAVILMVVCFEIIMQRAILRRAQDDTSGAHHFDIIDALILLFIGIAVIVTVLPIGTTSTTAMVLGVKYDLIPLIILLLLRRVAWSEEFVSRLLMGMVIVGCIIAAYGIATMVLPMSFFTALGYSDLHSLYVPNASLAPFQQIGGTAIRRIQSVMSGPNQMGLWLLIPWSVCWGICLRRKVMSYWLLVISCIGLGILLTFSRAAWISAAVITVIAIRTAWSPLPLWERVRVRGIAVFLGCCVLVGATLFFLFPQILLRVASSRDHLLRPLAAIDMITEAPFGRGLGAAGPASNRVSDACVHLEAGADASWAADRPDLCVFVGSEQVQPADHSCQCPVLTENWYLQVGVELGVAGMIVFMLLMIVVLRQLIMDNGKLTITTKASAEKFSILNSQFSIFSVFLGLAIASLFLHAFEDSAVAWTVWGMVAMLLSARVRP
jgi:hypothetical protein